MKKKIITIISFIMIFVTSMTGLSTVGYAFAPVAFPKRIVLGDEYDLSVSNVYTAPDCITIKWEEYDSRFSILVYRRDVSPRESQWTRIAVLKPGSTKYTDRKVVEGKSYYYVIKAYYQKVEGSYLYKYITDGDDRFRVTAELPKPAFKMTSNMGKGVVMQWNTIPEGTGFAIYRSPVGKKNTWTRIATIKSNKAGQFIDTKVNIGETYYYCFKVFRTVGNKTYYSESSVVHKKVISGVTPPQNFKAVVKEDGIHISYEKVPGVLGYSIYRREDGTDKWIKIAQPKSVNTLSFVDKTAEKGKTYTYTAKSYKTVNGKTTSSKSAKDVVVKYITDKPVFAFEPNEITFKDFFAETDVTFSFKNIQYDDNVRIFINDTELTEELLKDEEALRKVSEKWNFFFYVDESKVTNTRMVLRVYRVGPGEGTLRFQHSEYDDVYAELKVICPALPFDEDYEKIYENYSLCIEKLTEARDVLDDTLELTDENEIDKCVESAKVALSEAKKSLSDAFDIVDKYRKKYGAYSEFQDIETELSDLAGCLATPINTIEKYTPEDRNKDYIQAVRNSLSSTLKQYEE